MLKFYHRAADLAESFSAVCDSESANATYEKLEACLVKLHQGPSFAAKPSSWFMALIWPLVGVLIASATAISGVIATH